MSDRPCDTEEPAPAAVASFEQYQKAKARFRGSNVLDFNRPKRAHNQTALDLANAFRSANAGKYDDEPEGAA